MKDRQSADRFLARFPPTVDQMVRTQNAIPGQLGSQMPRPKRHEGFLRSHPQRKIELARQPLIDRMIPDIILQRAHVRVEVGDIDARLQRFPNLRPPFVLSLLRRGVGIDLRDGRPQIPLRIHQTRHAVARAHRSPTILLPFAGMRQVDAKIQLGVPRRIGRNLWEPRTRHHDGRAGHQTVFQAVDARHVRGMAHPHVIAVHNQQPILRTVAQSFGQRALRRQHRDGQPHGQRRACAKYRQPPAEPLSSHPAFPLALTPNDCPFHSLSLPDILRSGHRNPPRTGRDATSARAAAMMRPSGRRPRTRRLRCLEEAV